MSKLSMGTHAMLRNMILLTAVTLATGAAHAAESATKIAVYGGVDPRPAIRRAITAERPDYAIYGGGRVAVPPVAGQLTYRSFDAGPVHVPVLDSRSSGDHRRGMLDWLSRDLAGSSKPWTVAVIDGPIFSVAAPGAGRGRDDLLPLLEERGVDVVIAGGGAAYERFVPIGPAGGKPVIHVVTAGEDAGAEPARSPMLEAGYGYGGPHYCLFEVSGDRLEMTMRRPDGSVLDRMVLVKTDGAYQPEVMAKAVQTQRALVLAPLFTDFDANFPQFPEPGQPTRLILDGSRFPEGSWVTVSAAQTGGGPRRFGGGAAPRGWTVPEQRLRAADPLMIEGSAPAVLTAGPDGFSPPLWLRVAVEQDGQTYTADLVQVPLTEKMLAGRLPEPEAVPVPRARRTIAVDGERSDWAGIGPTPLPFHDGGPGSVSLCWREDGLYGLAVVEDDSIERQATAPWAGDGLELFIDRDYSRRLMKTGTAAQIGLSPAPQTGPGRAHVTITYGGGPPEAAQVDCQWQPTANGYVLEFRLPPQIVAPASLSPGTKFGLNFMVDDDTRHVECFYTDNSVMEGWRTPITWGAVVLAE